MFKLTVKTERGDGVSWPIATKPLVLGRSTTCDVIVRDPAVSRKHCELREEKNAVWIKDLGSSNATLLNGKPVTEARLRHGDEIRLGAMTFTVTRQDDSITPAIPIIDESTPVTISLSEAYYVQNREQDDTAQGRPQGIEEFRRLFSITRRFSRAESVAELVDALVEEIRDRFAPDALWLAWIIKEDLELAFYPMEGAAPRERAPIDNMRRALAQNSGVLVSAQPGESQGASMIAPLAFAGAELGVVAIASEGAAHNYSREDLEYFIAVAHAFAPCVHAAERVEQLRRDNEQLKQEVGVPSQLIGASKPMRELRSLVAKAAQSQLNVLVLGETGSGKELIARMVHEMSPRNAHPFVVVNCAAIPTELFESEMFGHEKGAFTGAIRRKIGRFEEAHSGTLFLDEIGDLSTENQARVLRAIENGTFYRVGGNTEISVDVRVVSATNKDLTGDAAAGFRMDLFHRLGGFEVRIPPLRDRKSDIPLLADYFLELLHQRRGGSARHLTEAAAQKLQRWHWPGNVRELRSCLERAAALASHDDLLPEHITFHAAPNHAPEENGTPFKSLADTEREHVRSALQQCAGNISAAARALGITRPTLYRKIRDHNIEL